MRIHRVSCFRGVDVHVVIESVTSEAHTVLTLREVDVRTVVDDFFDRLEKDVMPAAGERVE